jgi:hypothetical protein
LTFLSIAIKKAKIKSKRPWHSPKGKLDDRPIPMSDLGDGVGLRSAPPRGGADSQCRNSRSRRRLGQESAAHDFTRTPPGNTNPLLLTTNTIELFGEKMARPNYRDWGMVIDALEHQSPFGGVRIGPQNPIQPPGTEIESVGEAGGVEKSLADRGLRSVS